MDDYQWMRSPGEQANHRRPPPGTRPAPAETTDTPSGRTAGGGCSEPVLLRDLSEGDREILRYVPSMLSAVEIGTELHISVNTVKAHLHSIYHKLGVSRRRDAVIQAHRHGLL